MADRSNGPPRPPHDVAGEAANADARQRALRRLDRLAHVLDTCIPVPLLRTRIGLDGLIGLVPGIGDAATGILSLYPVVEAWRLGLPVTTILRMLGNVGVDTVIGAIPLAGDLFDFAYKANRRNVDLLRQALRARGVDESAPGG
ncbi:DUF4112 domain-containing protein [Halofilum ochraceum]|uniref:DUF4112 domain-containing protein n=1 Tax=Halofilum ochraceum TaxID=1611323 RepID=UPI0008DA9245|nr:DUF4112 domain-containing protein [Halofilum ochraceum]